MRNEKQRNGIKIFNEKYITKRLICEGVPVSILSDLFLFQSFLKIFPFSNVFLVLYLQKIRFTINDVLSPPV